MPEKPEKTIVQLISELTQDARRLFRQEMELFTAEMKQKLVELAKDAVGIGIGVFLLYLGSLVLVAAIVLGLATALQAWGAALVVAAALLAAGLALVGTASKDLTQMEKRPEQTQQALKETVQWAKTLRLRSTRIRRRRFASKSETRKAI